MGRALKVGECSLKEVYADKIGTDEGVTALLMGLAHCPDLERASFRHFSPPLQEKTVEMAMKNVKNRDVWPKLERLDSEIQGQILRPQVSKIPWQPPVRLMLSQENGAFAFECVIQSYIMFPDYSRDSLNSEEWFRDR